MKQRHGRAGEHHGCSDAEHHPAGDQGGVGRRDQAGAPADAVEEQADSEHSADTDPVDEPAHQRANQRHREAMRRQHEPSRGATDAQVALDDRQYRGNDSPRHHTQGR